MQQQLAARRIEIAVRFLDQLALLKRSGVHFSAELVLNHGQAGRTDDRVNPVAGTQQNFQQSHGVDRTARPGNRNDEVFHGARFSMVTMDWLFVAFPLVP